MSANFNFKPRSNRGSLSVLIPLFIVLALVGIGAFGMDISHNVTVRSELQSATDAAALAGAQALVDPATEKNAFNDALAVAATNKADGKAVSNTNSSFSVVPEQGSGWDSVENSNTFKVTASKSIRNVFAKLFKHHKDTVGGRSVARAWRSLTAIDPDYLFPMAVSIDTMAGHDGKPLYMAQLGDIVSFEINSQQYKNAAFTTFNIPNTNANTITKLVEMNLNIQPKNGSIPGMTVGDTLNLTNGVAEQKQLAKGEYVSALTAPDKVVLLPVMSGEAPYNGARKLVGFLGVKIKNVKINQKGGQVESFEAQIVKAIVKGKGGIPKGTPDSNVNNGMKNISAGTFKLEA